jgi:hypothetical protein
VVLDPPALEDKDQPNQDGLIWLAAFLKSMDLPFSHEYKTSMRYDHVI